jgi:hypothetical protein
MPKSSSAVQSAVRPVYGGASDVVKLDANSVAGTAESLLTEIEANGGELKNLNCIEVFNTTSPATNVYLRTTTLTAAGTGKGIVIPPGASYVLPIDLTDEMDHALLYEAATEIHCALFYA